jgi:hypothetical protein
MRTLLATIMRQPAPVPTSDIQSLAAPRVGNFWGIVFDSFLLHCVSKRWILPRGVLDEAVVGSGLMLRDLSRSPRARKSAPFVNAYRRFAFLTQVATVKMNDPGLSAAIFKSHFSKGNSYWAIDDSR